MPETPNNQVHNDHVYPKFLMPTVNTSKVLKKTPLNASAIELELEKPLNFTYKIGQFISVKVSEKNFRAYSLASHPNEYVLKVVAAVGHEGLGANYLKNINIDEEISFIGPSGRFFMADSPAPNILFLATGTGIAPFIPMLRELIEYNKAPKTKIQLFFGETQEKELFYMDLLKNFKNSFSGFDFKICLSQENNPNYEFGRITGKYTIFDPLNTQVYVCGHPNMVVENVALLKQMAIPENQIFQERFTSALPKS